MKTVGIIAEYDPFHNGHEYHLKKAKEITGAETAVAVISGSFTQRGSAAFFDKKVRAQAALTAGADLVLELPYIYACNAGSEFAYGGAAVLHHTGIVTDLVFGSECGDIELLKNASAASDTAEQRDGRLTEEIQKGIRSGLSYPAAFSRAVSEMLGKEAGDIFQNPNDVLGMGYISALRHLGSSIEPHCILRAGAEHHQKNVDDRKCAGQESRGEQVCGGEGRDPEPVASGTALRRLIRQEGIEAARCYLPEAAHKIFSGEIPFDDGGSLYHFLRYKLLTSDEKRLEKIYSVTEGIQNRMKAAALQAESYEEYMRLVKTKRYTWAQIQRMNVHILMDFTKEAYRQLKGTAYVRILGFSPEGAKLLRQMRKEGGAEIISNLSGLSNLRPRTKAALEMEIRAADLRNLLQKKSPTEFSERKFVPVKV